MAQAAYNSSTQYSRRLEDFRGVDLSSGQAQVSPRRFTWAQNMWRDYSSEQGGAIETVPGYRQLADFEGKRINGIWSFKDVNGQLRVMVHAGDMLYSFNHTDRDAPAMSSRGGLADAKSTAFVFNGRFYILDGQGFKVFYYDESNPPVLDDATDVAYLPVTFINGEMYEQRNMLLDRTVNRETQAAKYSARRLYKYKNSAGRGAFAGFADKVQSDTFLWIEPLQAADESGAISYGVAGDFAEQAFSDADSLKRVIAGSLSDDSLYRAIWHEPFAECKNLELVALFNMGVHGGSFRDCPKLREVQIDVDYLSDGAFAGSDAIEKIIFSGADTGLKKPFGNLPRLRELAISSDAFVLPAFVINAGYNSDYINRFPYNPRPNSAFDPAAEVTAENFPYALKPNPGYVAPSQPQYDVIYTATTPGDGKTDYIITVSKDVDWSLPSNYNQLPFLLEEVVVLEPTEDDEAELEEVTRYRAAVEYLVTGTFGTLESLERVYIPDTESMAEVREAFTAVSDAEIVTDEFPEPMLKATEITTEDGSKQQAIDLIARELVAYDPASDVVGVEVDGKPLENYGVVRELVDGDWLVSRVLVYESLTAADPLTNHELDVILDCVPGKFTTAEGYLNFAAGNTEYKGTSKDAITKCTVSATFDGRIFLTGNPDLPNTVFYCQRDDTGYANPAYWGVLNFINDGVGQSRNVAMLATANTLMVLKGNDPHDATIYYHTGVDSGNDVIPRIYPSERGLAGVGCTGLAVNFRDDAVFMSPAGLEAVGKQQVNLERTLAHRSTLIDRVLTREQLSAAIPAEWEGYLMIFTPSGAVYMADSRQMYDNPRGGVEYEWHHMADVGCYEGQTEDYEQVTGDGMLYGEDGGHWLSDENMEAYAVIGGKRYLLQPCPDHPEYVAADGVGMSYIYRSDTGNAVWYTDPELTAQARLPVALFNGEAYIVTESGRYSGGTFNPVTAAANVDGVLYFGTANGALMCFNTDKRDVPVNGEAPPAGTMHRSWYTFNGRQIDSVLTTAYDNAGFPDLVKKTVKKSMVVYAKTYPGTRLEVKVRTNRNDDWRLVGTISVATYDFYSLDYASAPLQLADETLATVREKEKKWVLKQLCFGSAGFMAPWGLYRAGYRFTVTGRIKT